MLAVSLIIFACSHLRVITKASGVVPSLPNTNRHKSSRHLIPHPPMPPHPHGHHHSSGYYGCFGISDDEVLTSAAEYFGDDIPPCAVYVNDTLVAGSGSSSSSGSWWSGWFGGGGSGGGSGSGSGSGGSGGSSGGSDSSSYGGNDNGGNINNDNGSNNNNNNERANNDYGNVNGDGEYSSALVYFDLTDCRSYSNLWLWDLALSCDNSTSFVNCKCSSAEILFQYGTLQCPDGSSEAPYCPSNCPVCNTCMTLMGCVDKLPFTKRIPVNIPVSLEKTINRTLPIALGVAAAVVTLLAGVAAHKYKNQEGRGKSAGSLNSSLVDGQSESTVEIDIAGNAHVL
jgi:hypothetical protein